MSFVKENIIDPALERIDPTPNIHDLFRQFNRRFFWGKLDMVEVAWSGRQMTSCAGVCSFQPRSGHCIIKLSAPLLSLRSRKDLIETLLHEMIHAYLFMTKNYRDRSDHGPEFHKHMYRINQETGTNITVFHTFNDEVRYYQTHVWRCNGPCQKMQPFFGIVRRATNRAPGPNDTWWSAHKMKCNGQFEKIEEPPGYKNKKKKVDTENNKGAKDIRNFFTPVKGKPNGSNIHTLSDISSNIPSGVSKNKEPATFTVTGKPSYTSTPKPKYTTEPSHSTSSTVTGGVLKKKGPPGYTVSGKPSFTSTPKSKRITESSPFQPSSATTSSSVQEQMRNVWANKFPQKRKIFEESEKDEKVIVECEECSQLVSEKDLESHKSHCFEGEPRPCPVCNQLIRQGLLEKHLSSCLSDSITEDLFACEEEDTNGNAGDEESVDAKKSINVDCPICGSAVKETEINSHIDECLTLHALKQEM